MFLAIKKRKNLCQFVIYASKAEKKREKARCKWTIIVVSMVVVIVYRDCEENNIVGVPLEQLIWKFNM